MAENESHKRRKRTSFTGDNIQKVRELIEQNHRVNLSEMASILIISVGSVHVIISNYLELSKCVGKVVPKSSERRRAEKKRIKPSQQHLHRYNVLKHLPCNPDLSPCDFHVFRPLKESMGGMKFTANTDVEKYVRNYFRTRPRSLFAQGIKKLSTRWEKCILKREEYVEK